MITLARFIDRRATACEIKDAMYGIILLPVGALVRQK
jgi:hypothetical protein